MSTTIPALSSVDDILDSDLVMITHSNGESFKIAGSEINKRNQAVIASGTTITGAPLKTGNIVRVYFTADITGSNTSTGLTLNYNGVNKSVKVPKNGTLANFVASDLGGSPTVYKYLQAHTTLELLYDGTQFIIIENPVVISGSNFRIHADGSGLVNTVTGGNMRSVTSAAVSHALSNSANELPTGAYWINNKPIYKKTISVTMNNEQATTDVRGLSISTICKIEAIFVHRNWANWIIPIPTIISQNSNIGGIVYDNGDLIVLVNNNTATETYKGTAYITIYYTKTTD